MLLIYITFKLPRRQNEQIFCRKETFSLAKSNIFMKGFQISHFREIPFFCLLFVILLSLCLSSHWQFHFGVSFINLGYCNCSIKLLIINCIVKIFSDFLCV